MMVNYSFVILISIISGLCRGTVISIEVTLGSSDKPKTTVNVVQAMDQGNNIYSAAEGGTALRELLTTAGGPFAGAESEFREAFKPRHKLYMCALARVQHTDLWVRTITLKSKLPIETECGVEMMHIWQNPRGKGNQHGAETKKWHESSKAIPIWRNKKIVGAGFFHDSPLLIADYCCEYLLEIKNAKLHLSTGPTMFEKISSADVEALK